MIVQNHPTKRKKGVPAILIVMLAIVMAASLGSCTDIVSNIDFPDTEPKIVVHAFISPADTAVQVMLSWSNPISKGASMDTVRYIENATVRMAETGKAFSTLAFHQGKKVYALPASMFPIETGKHYSLNVDVPGHNTVAGSCYIPPANHTLALEKIEREKTEWSEIIRVEFSFSDIPGENENFYTMAAYLNSQTYIMYDDTVQIEAQRFHTISGESYISNKGREGRKFITRAEGYHYKFDWLRPPGSIDDSPPVYLLLLTTDEHYYHYHKTLENYHPNNPFAEPVLIYSNIEGGLGVFAGINRTELIVTE